MPSRIMRHTWPAPSSYGRSGSRPWARRHRRCRGVRRGDRARHTALGPSRRPPRSWTRADSEDQRADQDQDDEHGDDLRAAYTARYRNSSRAVCPPPPPPDTGSPWCADAPRRRRGRRCSWSARARPGRHGALSPRPAAGRRHDGDPHRRGPRTRGSPARSARRPGVLAFVSGWKRRAKTRYACGLGRGRRRSHPKTA